MKKVLSIVAALIFISVSFISCKDANGIESNKLIGKWSWTSIQVTEKSGGEVHNSSYDYSEEGLYYEFLSDGKYVISQLQEGTIDSGSWTLAQSTLTLKPAKFTEEEVWTVAELTSASLKIEMSNSSKEGGTTIEVHYVYSFTKVK